MFDAVPSHHLVEYFAAGLADEPVIVQYGDPLLC